MFQILLGFGIGYYWFVLRPMGQSSNPVQNPVTSSTLQTQPSQVSPWQLPLVPRADNANQPWYGGNTDFKGSKDSVSGNNMAILGASPSDSMSSFSWENLTGKYTN